LIAPVSVVIPCYRCAATIGRALASVLAQTRRPAEIILVDDASDDASCDAARAFPETRIIRLEKNLGPGGARNAGWDMATQDYVAFLDADDAWHPRKLELQLGWMQAHPEADLTGHATLLGEAPLEVSIRGAWRVTPAMLLLANRFSTPTVVLRRGLPQRFAAGKRHSEDYLLWLELALAGRTLYRLEAPLAVLFKPAYGAGGLSGQLWRHEAGELDAIARLRRAGQLGRASAAAASAWSCLKFGRRLLLSALRARA
jgi:glycosyltransferase involved in cell wall biosynthesis